jgi:hypothetical protein
MAAPLKQAKPETQGASRRSTRLAIAIPITINGKDSGGHTFKENSRTVVINKHGAKILTFHDLGLGTEITIENRALGRSAQANVVWQGERSSPKDPIEVGIQLVHAENIWGIEFPPDDWQEGPPPSAAVQKPEPAVVAAPASPSSYKAPEIPRPPVPPVVLPPTPTAAPGFLDAAAQASLARFNQQIEDTFSARFRQFEQRITALTQQIGLQTQAALQEMANHQEGRVAQALEQHLANLEQRLPAARADLEALLNRLQEVRETAQREIEKAERNIQTASFAALQAATEELHEKVRQELDAASASFVEETRKRVADTAAAAVETFTQQADMRMTTLTRDYVAALTPQLEARRTQFEKTLLDVEQKGSREILDKLRQVADESLEVAAKELQKQAADAALLLTDELTAAGKRLLDEARQELRTVAWEASESIRRQAEAAKGSAAELEAKHKTTLEESGKQLDAIVREALENLSKQTEAARIATAELEALGKTAVEETGKQLAALTQEASEAITKMAEAVKRSNAELALARETAVEEAKRQIAAVSREALDTVSKDTRAAQLSTAALEAAGKAAVEQTREQLTLLGRETMEMLTEEARTLAKEYPVHVRKTLQEFQDQRTRELEDHLQKALEKQRQAVLKQVQRVGEEVAGQAVAEVRSRCEQVVKEILGDLEKQRGATAATFIDWEKQARARLERQATSFSSIIAEKVRQESEPLMKEFQRRLQQATGALYDQNLREIEEKLREFTLKQIEESAAEFDRRAADNLELVSEQLKEKQEQAVEEATELFRTTIGQMFASLQLAPKKPAEAEPAKKRR